MKGWRGHAADVFTDQGEIEAKKKFAPGSVPLDSVKFHDRFLIIRKGGYIGRSLKFGERVAGMLPAMSPRQGMKSLRLCMALSWELPRRAA